MGQTPTPVALTQKSRPAGRKPLAPWDTEGRPGGQRSCQVSTQPPACPRSAWGTLARLCEEGAASIARDLTQPVQPPGQQLGWWPKQEH